MGVRHLIFIILSLPVPLIPLIIKHSGESPSVI